MEKVMKGRKKPKRKNNSSSRNIAMKLQLGALIIAVATLLSVFTSKPPVEREPLLSIFTSHSPVEREPLLSVSTSHSPVEREPDTHCSDHKKLMPFCERCIPGLTFNEESKTCELSEETSVIRKTLFKIARRRGNENTCKVYNYLSTETHHKRHQHAAKYLDMVKPGRQRACVNFAEMLVDETVVSELMLRRAFRVTDGNRS